MNDINLFTDLFEEEKREEEVQKILPVPLWKKIARIVIVFSLLAWGVWYYIGWYMTKQAYLTEQSSRGINTSDYDYRRYYFDGEPEEFHSYKDFDGIANPVDISVYPGIEDIRPNLVRQGDRKHP